MHLVPLDQAGFDGKDGPGDVDVDGEMVPNSNAHLTEPPWRWWRG